MYVFIVNIRLLFTAVLKFQCLGELVYVLFRTVFVIIVLFIVTKQNKPVEVIQDIRLTQTTLARLTEPGYKRMLNSIQ